MDGIVKWGKDFYGFHGKSIGHDPFRSNVEKFVKTGGGGRGSSCFPSKVVGLSVMDNKLYVHCENGSDWVVEAPGKTAKRV